MPGVLGPLRPEHLASSRRAHPPDGTPMSCRICCVGSIHMDLVVRAPRFPECGETLMGGEFERYPGGKGANQAVAAGRMGAQVRMVGCLGDDSWGAAMRGALTVEGVDIQHVRTDEKHATGVAVVTVVPGGEHSIVVAPGANAHLMPDDLDQASGAIAEADVLIVQAEIPVETNLRAMEIAKNSNTAVVFNAAPAVGLDPELLKRVDLLVVNCAEARRLVGDDEGEVAPTGLARRLASYGPDRVVITLASEGAIHFNGQEMESFEAFPVECVDSTAAGDAFVGALAVLRSEGARLMDAVRHACGAGALAAGTAGAIPSLPTRDEVDALVKPRKQATT